MQLDSDSVVFERTMEDDGDFLGKKVTVGVCVMEKKMFSAPMKQILDRLQAFGEFEIIHFGDKVILEEPVERWPICDCLIAFHSNGYPLEKAEAYAALRKYALVNREKPYQDLDYFVEEEDFVEVHNERFWKPFVEKPVDGDNHSIMIYYPSSAGGGMKELFRKVGNRSSDFHPEVRRVRREGSYIYEEFMPTGGTDVKVYTVGPEYAHAEARKSPVVDGVVMRNPDGKEVRYPVLLTPMEKQMAREVCIAFRQSVCGFDLLRCEGRSYVCDVNGWSFVKNSYKYYDDAACVLRKMFLDAKAPHLSSVIPPTLPWKSNEPSQASEGLTRQGSGIIGTFGQSEELRCVIAIIRHGDRTPKQKVKLKVTEEKLLNLMLKYNGGRPRSETKLKSAIQLQDLLDATRMLVPRIRPGRESDSEAEDFEHAEKLRQVKAVLEEGGHFSGIYRKVQLKPLKWVKVAKANGEGEEERPVEALMVLKYGGVLTHAGRKQAEELGRYFRNNMYPGEGTGLLRLHSTYRHDLKIYSSDEGRVQMSAAAFAKGLLDLEGQLTPILARLNEIITSNAKTATAHSNGSPSWMADGAGLPFNAFELLPKLVELTKKVTEQVRLLAKDEDEELTESSAYDVIPPYDQAKALGKTNIDIDRIAAGLPCGSEGFLLMYARWRKLERDLYNERKVRFDITQIPDVYDSCKYDLLHNAHLNLDGLDELFKVAQQLADGVIPNEYGINPKQKLKIGSKIARRLLGKMLIDLRNTREEAISVAELKCSQEQDSRLDTEKEDAEYQSMFNIKNDDMKKLSTNSEMLKVKIKNDDMRRTSTTTSEISLDQDEDDDKEPKYRLDPKYANVKTPERHVRTRLYFTSESHIHSLMNVLRYCNLDESLLEEESLVCHNALERLHNTKELDYMSYIVLRMFENTEVALEDPKRYRIEMTFSRGADLSPLEKNDSEAASLHQEHTLPIMGPERLQEVGSYLTLETLEKMVRPFAMPAEDFPPPSTPAGFSGYFSKSAAVLERLTQTLEAVVKESVDLENVPLEEVFQALVCNKHGLTTEAAQQRLTIFGYNKLEEKKESKFLKFLGFMWNPLSWVMEAAAIMAIALANGGGKPPDWQDFVGIIILLLINSTISFIEENNAGNAAAALMARLAPKAKGEIEAVVIATGVHTFFGKAAHLVDSTNQQGHFQKRTALTYTDSKGKMHRVSKGAPEQILNLAHNKSDIEKRVHAVIDKFAERGLRSLAVAYQEVSDGRKESPGGPWKFAGLMPLFDPPRHDSAETIRKALYLGVNVKMITGDQLAIAKETGRRLGMGTNMYPSSALLGQEKDESIAALPVDDLIEKADGFAGVFPEHKYEIVRRLQARKHICGMTGDGVNDAPALKKADIGIAVADATDAARSASDIVLTQPGLSVIISAVLTSRSIFQRMKNYTIYAVSITIRIVLGFMLLALIWKFDFPPFMVLIIAILNDGTIMTISKDRVKPSPLPDSWKLAEIFTTGIILGGYLAMMTVIFFWAAYKTDFFPHIFGVSSLQQNNEKDFRKLASAIYLQVSTISQALIFVTRSRSWSFLERPGLLLVAAFAVAQLIATLIAVYANWSFAAISGIGWGWAGVVWLYNIIFYFPLDLIKFFIRYALSGRAWDLVIEQRIAFTRKKDFGKEERELKWAHAQRTLHGLHPPEGMMFADRSTTELNQMAEDAKRRAEIARLRELHTLKGHVESVVRLKGLDINTIQQAYTAALYMFHMIDNDTVSPIYPNAIFYLK
ncbi:hypothetical protein G4B88_015591 [Cannabis sativa]|uniref:Inositol hexakisphosphate and diphosphoinositol-pentakisphosphate kinase n=1 Tax=Cannabis sativa TaxID=3483 RepID=A0A7J6H6Y2_CANSA|nr:hypothetical protein G4B88_015591 [Cannabis sativa]